MKTLIFLIIFSGTSFMIYGLLSFISKSMQDEIDRWGFSKYKYALGICQLFGGFGLILGLKWLIMAQISSFLISLMMISALYVRIQIKDKIIRFTPAIVFLIINVYIFILTC